MLARLRRDDSGFGLVELIIAMTVLNIGLLALVAALNSGALALARASRVSTGATLADAQMELYRALRYVEIRLDTPELARDDDNATYTGDPAYSVSMVTDLDTQWTPCTDSPVAPECDASRTVAGPDGVQYRIDTYISIGPPENVGTASARDVKRVTVVVRDANDLSHTFVRQQSTFDQSTG